MPSVPTVIIDAPARGTAAISDQSKSLQYLAIIDTQISEILDCSFERIGEGFFGVTPGFKRRIERVLFFHFSRWVQFAQMILHCFIINRFQTNIKEIDL